MSDSKTSRSITKLAMVAFTATLLVEAAINPALAVTQGTRGATSTGSVNITVAKASQARISGLSDLTLPGYSIGDGNKTLSTTACVYSTGGSYTVKATGSGGSNAFTLASGANTIPYTIVWNSGGVGALGTTGMGLTTNVTSATLLHAATDSATCAGAAPGPTAQVNVNISGANLDAAPAGTFTGTLTLLVISV